ncbi:MAG: caspase family protein [Capsulimonadaceae bacterium]
MAVSWRLVFVALLILNAGHGLLSAAPLEGSTTGSNANAPRIQIESGVHSSFVYNISTDARQRYLASCSYDATVRVWNAATGDLLNVIRPPIPAPCAGRFPIEAGHAGKLFGVAISPDAQQVACAGWTGGSPEGGYTIYIFDRITGLMDKRITGLTRQVYKLAYSPDGKYLAAGTGAGCGVLLFRTSDYSLAAQDRNYDDKVFGLDFGMVSGATPGLRLAAASLNGTVHLYTVADGSQKTLSLDATYVAASSLQPYSIAFSPDCGRLAVGLYHNMRVLVLACNSAASGFVAERTVTLASSSDSANDDLRSVAWSAGGRTLYAAGLYRKTFDGQLHEVVRRWPNFAQAETVDIPVANDSIFGLISRQDGGIFWASGDSTIGAIAADGHVVFRSSASEADLSCVRPWRVSNDGRQVNFGYGAADVDLPGQDFSLNDGGGVLAAHGQSTLDVPHPSSKALRIDGVQSETPQLNGVPLTIEKHEISEVGTVAPDDSSIVLGTSWHVYKFDRTGQAVWKTSISADAHHVSISGDGRLAVVALGNGTIHWYRMSDGQELLTLFPHADRKRWVAWTPSGYYDCSPGAEDMIGWHVNRGPDQAADFFPASRFRDTYYRPDVVGRILTALDEAAAVTQADQTAGRTSGTVAQAASIVATKQPPVVTIISPETGQMDGVSTVVGEKVFVQYNIRTPSGDPATDIRVLVNGRPSGDPRPLSLMAEDTSTPFGVTLGMAVPVTPGDCTISLIAQSTDGSSAAATVALKIDSATADAGATEAKGVERIDDWSEANAGPKPILYVLAVGVGAYDDKSVRSLMFPARDATAFVDAVKLQQGTLYRDVRVYNNGPLTDGLATKDAIEDGLDWLVHQATDSNDVVMIYIAGHGLSDSGNYYFLPSNYDHAGLRRTGLPGTDLFTTLKSIPAKVILFDDSCYGGDASGGPNTTGFINALVDATNGAVVFAAATGDEPAIENPDWHNGAFTTALIEAMDGQAAYDHTQDYDRSGLLDFNMLAAYTYDRVRDLTNDRQHPAGVKPPTMLDFPIAARRDSGRGIASRSLGGPNFGFNHGKHGNHGNLGMHDRVLLI